MHVLLDTQSRHHKEASRLPVDLKANSLDTVYDISTEAIGVPRSLLRVAAKTRGWIVQCSLLKHQNPSKAHKELEDIWYSIHVSIPNFSKCRCQMSNSGRGITRHISPRRVPCNGRTHFRTRRRTNKSSPIARSSAHNINMIRSFYILIRITAAELIFACYTLLIALIAGHIVD
jgi:hypothetical protein